MVALGLILLIAALSLPSLAKLGRRHILLQQTRALAQDIELLVLDAWSTKRELTLELRPNRYTAQEKESGRMLFSKSIKAPLKLDLGHTAADLISFYPRQVVSPKSVLVNYADQSCRVVLALRGRVRFQC